MVGLISKHIFHHDLLFDNIMNTAGMLHLSYFTFAKHAEKNKMTNWHNLLTLQFGLEYHKSNSNNKNLNWNNKSCTIHRACWRWLSKFLYLSSILCYNRSISFPEWVRYHYKFLRCLSYLLMEYFDAHNFKLSTTGVIASVIF